MDFCVDLKIMNYIDPPPPKKPMLEEARNDRFTIAQLRSLLADLQELAAGDSMIENNQLIDLFLKYFFIRKVICS